MEDSASIPLPEQTGQDTPAQIFISYSSHDEATATDIVAALGSEGVSYWLAPREILSGWWPGQIVAAIRDCRLVLLVLSRNSGASPHVRREIALAAGQNKMILPFKVDDQPVADNLDYFLSGLQWQNGFPGPPSAYIEPLMVRVKAALLIIGQGSSVTKVLPRRAPLAYLSLAFALLLILAFWLQGSTNLGAWAFGALAAVVGSPLIVYQIIPDFWRPWTRAVMKTAWTSGRSWLKYSLIGANILLVCAFGATFFLGTLEIRSEAGQTKTRNFRVNGTCGITPGKIRPGETQRFIERTSWLHHSSVSVQIDGLGQASASLQPWFPVPLSIPSAYTGSPVLLIIPDKLLQYRWNRAYDVSVHIVRSGEELKPLPSPFKFAEYLSADGVRPFWIGCTGTMEVSVQSIGTDLQNVQSKEDQFSCKATNPLSAGDNVFLEMKGIDEKLRSKTIRIADSVGHQQSHVLSMENDLHEEF